jgi:hypothetical protein
MEREPDLTRLEALETLVAEVRFLVAMEFGVVDRCG